MEHRYSIGDVARRTGLSVSAIRYYCDEGIVAATEHTGAGYRQYDLHAIASLELVRTLRELGASLDEIRRVLADELTLSELAMTHLEIVERQLSQLQTRRAVLRTVVRQESTTSQLELMHELVSLSDDDRVRFLEEFWTEVTTGLAVQEFYVDHLRPWWPALPADPSTEQVEAWIELANMVQERMFREAVRDFFAQTFAASGEEPVDSPEARDIADRWVRWRADRLGDGDLARVRRQLVEADPAPHVERHVELLGRYRSLTATVNGAPEPPSPPAPASIWLHAAVVACT